MLVIYIDADGCSVKKETYKVAARFELLVHVVANQYLSTPTDPGVQMHVVEGDFDAADDWIAERIGEGDILITSDLLLADRAIKQGARVLGPKGKELSEDNIGDALATRELMNDLRSYGDIQTGPAPMKKSDRSQFLSKLDQIIHSIKN